MRCTVSIIAGTGVMWHVGSAWRATICVRSGHGCGEMVVDGGLDGVENGGAVSAT